MDQAEQMKKLNYLTEMANKNKDGSLAEKLSSFTIFTGLFEFHCIQAARLIEQILLKAQLISGKTPTFKPNHDQYFYDKQTPTRFILKWIKEFLPFTNPQNPQKDTEINGKIQDFLKLGNKFLNYRNAITHRIGSPRMSLEDIQSCCDKALDCYAQIQGVTKEMFESLQPYRFSDSEINYFYGNK